jgi:AcrR family transcriptional regulator
MNASPKRARDAQRTKAEMVAAALTTLKEEGYAGTTTRAIAQRGGFNQALIFYHFGGMNQLLLAALDAAAAERLARYRGELAGAASVEDKIATAARLYREDVAGGHITVVSELVAASLGDPDLAAEVTARLQPWLEFVEETFQELVDGTPLQHLVPVRETSFAFVALYLGLNLLSRLDPETPVDALFDLLRTLAPLLERQA